jgi:hypothetical protein
MKSTTLSTIFNAVGVALGVAALVIYYLDPSSASTTICLLALGIISLGIAGLRR